MEVFWLLEGVVCFARNFVWYFENYFVRAGATDQVYHVT